MISFKQFILEGGNVVISTPKGDVAAERIDLSNIDRDWVVDRLYRTLKVINLSFQKISGLPLWDTELFKSKRFLSGSSFHFFNKAIPSKEFIQFKNKIGDLDTQCDSAQSKNIEEFLNVSTGKKFGYATLVGYKKSADQYITLWQFDKPAQNVQIDLELVDFANGKPTPWSQFSHSSAWEDIKEGIKGVWHKMVLRAVTTKALRDIIILKGKKETPTKVTSTDLAFSVGKGLRVKIEPVMDGNEHRQQDGLLVYREIPTSKSTYINDLGIMFEVLFGSAPTSGELDKFSSFVGLLELINKYMTPAEKQKVVIGFAHSLWSPGAQGIYRGDPEADHKDKMTAFTKMVSSLKVSYDEAGINKMRVSYYENYKS
jgi:hypothetical protein